MFVDELVRPLSFLRVPGFVLFGRRLKHLLQSVQGLRFGNQRLELTSYLKIVDKRDVIAVRSIC